MTSCMYSSRTSGRIGQEGEPVPQGMVLLMVVSSRFLAGSTDLRKGKNLRMTSSVDFSCGAKFFHF